MQGDGYGLTKPYSDRTAELIDEEAREIVRVEYERAKELLREHAEGLKTLTQLLLDREVIYTEDVEHIFGKRPWVSRTDKMILEREEKNQEKEQVQEQESTTPTTDTEATSNE